MISLFKTKRQTIESKRVALMAKWHKPRSKGLARIISLLLSITFVMPHLTWAFNSGAFSSSANQVLFRNHSIKIPKTTGRITRSFPGGERLVVHIQDLHCHYEVQNNIAKIIHALAGRANLDLVAMEGADRPIKVDLLADFPINTVKHEVAHYLMKQGMISGPELYAATGRHGIQLEGIEQPDLYAANRRAVEAFLNNESQGYICDLRAGLNELKSRIYHSRLSKFDKQKTAWREGRISLLKYCVYLHRFGKRCRENMQDYPNLSQYVSWQANIFPDAMDADELFQELDRLDRRLRAILYTASAQEEMDLLQHRLDIMEKLLNISAAPRDLLEYRNNPENFRVSVFLDFMARYAEPGACLPDTEIYIIDRFLEQAKNFYQVADERSRAFVGNLVDRMHKRQADIAMLVSGGYHTDLVLSGLQSRGISYISVKPSLKRQDILNPYFALLQKKRTPLQKLLARDQEILGLELLWPAGQKEANPARRDFSNLLMYLLNIGALAESFKAGARSVSQLRSIYTQKAGEWAKQHQDIQIDWQGVKFKAQELWVRFNTGKTVAFFDRWNLNLMKRIDQVRIARLNMFNYKILLMPAARAENLRRELMPAGRGGKSWLAGISRLFSPLPKMPLKVNLPDLVVFPAFAVITIILIQSLLPSPVQKAEVLSEREIIAKGFGPYVKTLEEYSGLPVEVIQSNIDFTTMPREQYSELAVIEPGAVSGQKFFRIQAAYLKVLKKHEENGYFIGKEYSLNEFLEYLYQYLQAEYNALYEQDTKIYDLFGMYISNNNLEARDRRGLFGYLRDIYSIYMASSIYEDEFLFNSELRVGKISAIMEFETVLMISKLESAMREYISVFEAPEAAWHRKDAAKFLKFLAAINEQNVRLEEELMRQGIAALSKLCGNWLMEITENEANRAIFGELIADTRWLGQLVIQEMEENAYPGLNDSRQNPLLAAIQRLPDRPARAWMVYKGMRSSKEWLRRIAAQYLGHLAMIISEDTSAAEMQLAAKRLINYAQTDKDPGVRLECRYALYKIVNRFGSEVIPWGQKENCQAIFEQMLREIGTEERLDNALKQRLENILLQVFGVRPKKVVRKSQRQGTKKIATRRQASGSDQVTKSASPEPVLADMRNREKISKMSAGELWQIIRVLLWEATKEEKGEIAQYLDTWLAKEWFENPDIIEKVRTWQRQIKQESIGRGMTLEQKADLLRTLFAGIVPPWEIELALGGERDEKAAGNNKLLLAEVSGWNSEDWDRISEFIASLDKSRRAMLKMLITCCLRPAQLQSARHAFTQEKRRMVCGQIKGVVRDEITIKDGQENLLTSGGEKLMGKLMQARVMPELEGVLQYWSEFDAALNRFGRKEQNTQVRKSVWEIVKIIFSEGAQVTEKKENRVLWPNRYKNTVTAMMEQLQDEEEGKCSEEISRIIASAWINTGTYLQNLEKQDKLERVIKMDDKMLAYFRELRGLLVGELKIETDQHFLDAFLLMVLRARNENRSGSLKKKKTKLSQRPGSGKRAAQVSLLAYPGLVAVVGSMGILIALFGPVMAGLIGLVILCLMPIQDTGGWNEPFSIKTRVLFKFAPWLHAGLINIAGHSLDRLVEKSGIRPEEELLARINQDPAIRMQISRILVKKTANEKFAERIRIQTLPGAGFKGQIKIGAEGDMISISLPSAVLQVLDPAGPGRVSRLERGLAEILLKNVIAFQAGRNAARLRRSSESRRLFARARVLCGHNMKEIYFMFKRCFIGFPGAIWKAPRQKQHFRRRIIRGLFQAA